MKNLLSGFLFAAVLVSALSCSKVTGKFDDVLLQSNTYRGTNGQVVVCVWTNGAALPLIRLESNAQVNSVKAYGNDLYVLGHKTTVSNDQLACYWKNGKAVVLVKDPGQYCFSTVLDLAVSGGSVYAAGIDYDLKNQLSCLWKDGKIISETNGLMWVSIAVEGTDVYVSGGNAYIPSGPGDEMPLTMLMKNGVVTVLPTATGYGIANDVKVLGGKVYISGCELKDDITYRACYWIDGVIHYLDAPGTAYRAQNVDADGTNIVVSGTYSEGGRHYACYWQNGEFHALTAGDGGESEAAGVRIEGGDVYVGGRSYGDGASRQCYWKNGEFHALEVPAGLR